MLLILSMALVLAYLFLRIVIGTSLLMIQSSFRQGVQYGWWFISQPDWWAITTRSI